MLVGTLYLGYVFDVHHIMSILEYILDHNAKPDIWDYFKAMGVGWLKTIIPFLLVCMFTTILVSWFQSKMQLATEAVKFKFDSLNLGAEARRVHQQHLVVFFGFIQEDDGHVPSHPLYSPANSRYNQFRHL